MSGLRDSTDAGKLAEIAAGATVAFMLSLIFERLGLSASAPAHVALDELALALDEAFSLPPREFFRAADRARKTFARATKNYYATALLGLKILNLMIAKYEYKRGFIAKTSRPIGFMLDPANGCQLGCPACVNTANTKWSKATFKQPRPGTMKPEIFDAFISSIGPYAFAGHFYNNHEPLLNKRTLDYVRIAADLRVDTLISSNLSLPKLDGEAFVRSGLKELMVACDGLSQKSYERYRKGGRVDWIFANIRAIVAAKRAAGSPWPRLRWQYLTFEHNADEVPAAASFAQEIGLDTFNTATPEPVDYDDPSCMAVKLPEPVALVFNPEAIYTFDGDLQSHAPLIRAALSEKSLRRWRKETGRDERQRSGPRCDWLHLALTSDAHGRVLPCCTGDYVETGRFQYADAIRDRSNLLNTDHYRAARALMMSPAERKNTDLIRCDNCTIKPTPQVGLGAAHTYILRYPDLAKHSFLYGWSDHVN